MIETLLFKLRGFIYGKRYKMITVSITFIITLILYISLLIKFINKEQQGYTTVGVFPIQYAIKFIELLILILIIFDGSVIIKTIQYSIKINMLYLGANMYIRSSFENSEIYNDYLNGILECKKFVLIFANFYSAEMQKFVKSCNICDYEAIDLYTISAIKFRCKVLYGWLNDYIEKG